MKKIKQRVLLAIVLTGVVLMSSIAFAIPDGWTFSCNGTTGEYTGPNGSTMTVPSHYRCTSGGGGNTVQN